MDRVLRNLGGHAGSKSGRERDGALDGDVGG